MLYDVMICYVLQVIPETKATVSEVSTAEVNAGVDSSNTDVKATEVPNTTRARGRTSSSARPGWQKGKKARHARMSSSNLTLACTIFPVVKINQLGMYRNRFLAINAIKGNPSLIIDISLSLFLFLSLAYPLFS